MKGGGTCSEITWFTVLVLVVPTLSYFSNALSSSPIAISTLHPILAFFFSRFLSPICSSRAKTLSPEFSTFSPSISLCLSLTSLFSCRSFRVSHGASPSVIVLSSHSLYLSFFFLIPGLISLVFRIYPKKNNTKFSITICILINRVKFINNAKLKIKTQIRRTSYF